MTTRKPKDDDTAGDAAATVPDAAAEGTVEPTGDATADLANVDTSTYAAVEGATGTEIDGDLNIVEADSVDDEPIAALKALGNANPDVTVTAVQNGHGTWTWTARAADDGRELAAGGPHREARLIENLTLLFGDSTVALHRTGDEKARRLA